MPRFRSKVFWLFDGKVEQQIYHFNPATWLCFSLTSNNGHVFYRAAWLKPAFRLHWINQYSQFTMLKLPVGGLPARPCVLLGANRPPNKLKPQVPKWWGCSVFNLTTLLWLICYLPQFHLSEVVWNDLHRQGSFTLLTTSCIIMHNLFTQEIIDKIGENWRKLDKCCDSREINKITYSEMWKTYSMGLTVAHRTQKLWCTNTTVAATFHLSVYRWFSFDLRYTDPGDRVHLLLHFFLTKKTGYYISSHPVDHFLVNPIGRIDLHLGSSAFNRLASAQVH